MKTQKRFRIINDDDGHCYLIEPHQTETFEQLLDQGEEDNYKEFEHQFGDCRIDNPFRLTFIDPKEED